MAFLSALQQLLKDVQCVQMRTAMCLRGGKATMQTLRQAMRCTYLAVGMKRMGTRDTTIGCTVGIEKVVQTPCRA